MTYNSTKQAIKNEGHGVDLLVIKMHTLMKNPIYNQTFLLNLVYILMSHTGLQQDVINYQPLKRDKEGP